MRESDFQQLNIIFTEHNKVWCYCCFHKDTVRPNLSISLLDKYYGRYRCWACGREGCLSKEQVGRLNLSDCIIYKADRKSLDTRWRAFNESCYDNLQKFPLLKLGLAKQLNISIKSLDEWQIGFDGCSFTIPMFREDLEDYDREKGLCGVQRRFPDGTKRCVTGSRLGYMYPYYFIFSDGYIFICEGFSDGISVYDLGLNVISRPHCRHTEGIECYFDDVLEGIDTVIIIPDSDTVGYDGAIQLQSILENDYDCIIFSFDKAKDIREYITKIGKAQVHKELSRYV